MPNRLRAETSPYLQQHAENPVDWYPWGEEALALARAEDRPILLSVGYSACHWCHVMAHESFEDPDTAAVMNRLFVNIKVDREERPDLDQIYQTAHQMLTGRGGGWPLTVALTPEGVPFFAGTYFPKEARYGRPAFKDLLSRIEQAYRTQRSEIEKQNQALLAGLARSAPAPSQVDSLRPEPLRAAVADLARTFDRVHGGLGRAPKFPHPAELAFCLRRHVLDGDATAGEIARRTLTRMAAGGIFDQLGGGFCRYSTDDHWAIPHFEKMLYDNGPLLALYTDAWLVFREPLYAHVVEDTAEWIVREMQSPEGGYFSSLDADSEGAEGRFYVWTRDEARALLTDEEYAVVAAHFGLDGQPNFEQQHWHLRVTQPLDAVAQAFGADPSACMATLDSARVKLFAAREQRVRPGRDEKTLTSWNALTVRAMARAGRVFGREDWVRSARRAAAFLRSTLWRDGRLLATYKDGRAHLNAYLDDYAFLLDALVELLQTHFDPDEVHFAVELADVLLAQFEDREHGGFFFVSHDHECLIQRPKTGHDGATPAGNGVAAYALQRLGHLLGEPRFLAAAERALKLFFPAMAASPSAHTTLLTALEEALAPPTIVTLRGPQRALAPWQAALSRVYRPNAVVLGIGDEIPALPPALLKSTENAHDGVSAWVCTGVECLPPVFELAELERVLANRA